LARQFEPLACRRRAEYDLPHFRNIAYCDIAVQPISGDAGQGAR
jgi:hypothetical protein